MTLIPWPYRLLALAALAAALIGFGWFKGANHVQAQWGVRFWLRRRGDGRHDQALGATPNAVRQLPFQDGFQRKAHVSHQQHVRDVLSVPLCAVGEQVRRQVGGQGHVLGADVLNVGFVGFWRFGGVGLRRAGHDAWNALALTKNRLPVLRALALELEDVRLVVADVMEQLVPHGPFAVEAPAPQRLQADVPSGGDLLFSYYGVVHLVLLQRQMSP